MKTKTSISRLALLILLNMSSVLLAVCMTGCDSDKAIDNALNSFNEPPARDVAAQMFNPTDPDKRRWAVGKIANSSMGGDMPSRKAYQLLADDPDATVRAAAIQAIGKWGDVNETPVVIKRLKDEAPYVRWESANTLQRIHTENAIGPLMTAASKDEDADVRLAAADALAQFPDRRVFDTLVGMLVDPDYGVAHTAERSLTTLTGADLGPEGPPWLKFSQDNPGDKLFANQQQYMWTPFNAPRSFWARMAFWNPAPEPQPPQIPRGLAPLHATTQPSP